MLRKHNSLLLIAFLVLAFFAITTLAIPQDAVPLQDVTSLVLKRSAYTTGRRSKPVPQLLCVGGRAQGYYEPDAVLCTNVGFDGTDVTWKCEAELPSDYRLGETTVSCEGYAYPNDKNILRGSCGLEYKLEFTENAGRQRQQSYSSYSSPYSSSYSSSYDNIYRNISAGSNLAAIFVFLVIGAIIYLTCCTGSRSAQVEGSNNAGNWAGPGYPNTPGNTRSSWFPFRWSSSGPGLFSGLAAGGLLGYLFGRRGYQQPYHGGYNNAYGGYNGGYNSSYGYQGSSRYRGTSSSSSPSSSSTHRSTSYASTSRR